LTRRGLHCLRVQAAIPVAFAIAGLAGLTSGSAEGGEPAWRIYGGGFHYRWLTTGGEHGHLEDCRSKACDDADWRRANLDNAFGWRAGAERELLKAGRLRVLAGLEGAVLFSEYNSSQRDFALVEGLATGGIEIDLKKLRVLARAGAGGAATPGAGRGGVASFWEGGIDVPFGASAALRLGARRGRHAGPRTEEVSVLVVARPRGPESSPWALAWWWGVSEPGHVVGRDLKLTRAPCWHLAAHRRLGGGRHRLGLTLGGVGHESSLRSPLGEVPGNQRGRSVLEAGLSWEREQGGEGRLRWRWGLGLRTGTFRDDDAPFLVGEGGRTVKAQVEAALVAGVAVELARLGELSVLGSLEQVYWPGLRLGELRLAAGVEARP
jgi:hypothetical protein